MPDGNRDLASKRAAANAVALRAARTLLDAADDLAAFDLSVEGRPVHVELTRMDAPVAPSGGLLGVHTDRDGSLPRGVRAHTTWDGGSATLDVRVDWWRHGGYKNLIGLAAYVAGHPRPVLWNTGALAIEQATDDVATIPASFATFRRKGDSPDDAEARAWSIYELLHRSGLPLVSRWNAEWYRIRVPSGVVEPSPEEALRRTFQIALLKLPYFVRGGQKGINGVSPFEMRPATEKHGAAERATGADDAGDVVKIGKRDGLGPLPGGVREYKKTADALLAEVAKKPLGEEAFYAYLRDHYEVTGAKARLFYRNVLEGLRLIDVDDDDVVRATDIGRSYLERCDAIDLFDRLHSGYNGILDTLVVIEALGRADSDRIWELLTGLMGNSWESVNQVSFRRNWLLSLGMTERTKDGDALTDLGRTVLDKHGDEAVSIRTRLSVLMESAGPRPMEAAPDVGADVDIAPGLDDATPVADSAPSAWFSDRLDLNVDRLSPHLRSLSLAPVVLERVVAALGSGKHLLLIGPPGTGKTELARALCDAAAADGYCAGAFFATASADWTTFDTIGGYALQKDSSLRFRSGALLRAIETWRWLVIDELNRADVDRAFGELMSVLAGGRTDAPYELENGTPISIGPDPNATHQVPKTFRVLATMNTWDKTSLFRLSYAVQRRFAIVHVGVPDDEAYAKLLERQATLEGPDAKLEPRVIERVTQLFSTRGLFAHRPIGAAIALDVVRYARRRDAGGDGFAEALAMFLLPQLEGLDHVPAGEVFAMLKRSVDGVASSSQRDELAERFRDLFPHVKLSST